MYDACGRIFQKPQIITERLAYSLRTNRILTNHAPKFIHLLCSFSLLLKLCNLINGNTNCEIGLWKKKLYTYNLHLFWSSTPCWQMNLPLDAPGHFCCSLHYWLFSSSSGSYGVYQIFVQLLNFQGELSCGTYGESKNHKHSYSHNQNNTTCQD